MIEFHEPEFGWRNNLAVMIPNCGPAPTNSEGERLIYFLLKEQLGEDFTVIHSLPWLSAAAREVAGVKAVTGEIDFLILHAELGVLAIEVKGGAHKVQGLAFVHIKSGTTTRAVEQVRAGVHGLARWLGVNPALRVKIGYALVFPHSDFDGQVVSSALTDFTVIPPLTVVIDKATVPAIGSRVREIMGYWRWALSSPPLGEIRMIALIDALCPAFDGTPSWASRVVWDNKLWLRLTHEQSAVVDDAIAGNRLVVTGWPGTGKTLILIESARRLLLQGKRVLVLTFNTLLADHLRTQIGGNGQAKVGTWHSFCKSAGNPSQQARELDKDWLDQGCLEDINLAVQQGTVHPFDVILIDEAQTFRRQWIEWLCRWHAGRQLLAFCDETQVFGFEEARITLPELCSSVEVSKPFALTIPLRSPKAVFQRLKSVIKPEYQLHSPREFEVDAMEELLVVGMDDALKRTLVRLKSAGLSGTDVVVLSKFGWMEQEEGEVSETRFETVPRFRGLEASAIVICGAEQMDDTELFCAYSRATTRCIALYDAEVLGVAGPSCRFHASLLDLPANAEAAERARLSAQTGEIIQANFSPAWLDIQTAKIGWLQEWGAWVLERQDELSGFWSDYLVSHYPWPVYFWERNALRSIHLDSPITSVIDGDSGGVPHELLQCETCNGVSPHRRFPINLEWQCVMCSSSPIAAANRPSDAVLRRLKMIDDLLAVPDPRTLDVAQRKSLPLSLAAGAALSYAGRHACRNTLRFTEIPLGRITYRAALAFVYSFISLLPSSKNIVVATVAGDLYDRYWVPDGLTPEKWRQDLALAFGLAYRRGHLKKCAKGVYAPVGLE